MESFYRRSLQATRNRVVKSDLGKRMVSDIRTSHLREFLEPFAKTTHNRYLRQLHAIFEYAIEHDYARINPTDKISFFKENKTTIKVFSNDEIQGMLNLALKEKLEMVPYFALGAFTGIRIAGELRRLEWSDINWEAHKVVVRAEIAKTKHRRFIDMHPNLERWLKVYLFKRFSPNSKGKGKVFKLTENETRKAKGEIYSQVSPNKKWIKGGLRKSFASAMINSGEGRDKTCDALGHEGDQGSFSDITIWRVQRKMP